MAMQSGERDQIIDFQRLVSAPDGVGGQSQTWATIGQAWAAVKWIGGGEAVQAGAKGAGAIRATSKYRFTVLGCEVDALGITTTDRIVWDGVSYSISERPRPARGGPLVEVVAANIAGMS